MRIQVLASALAAGMLAAAGTVQDPPAAPRGTAAERSAAIAEAERATAEGAWSEAAEAWARVEALDGALAAAAYNRGVALYRQGEFPAAAEAFRRAGQAGDAELAARAMYNEGTARYAEALATLDAAGNDAIGGSMPPSISPPNVASGEDDGEPLTDPIQEAIDRVGRSMAHFRDAIDADPTNLDARANAELAHRLLRDLQQMQESMGNDSSGDGEPSDGEPQSRQDPGDGQDQQDGQDPPDEQNQQGEQDPQDEQDQQGEQDPQDGQDQQDGQDPQGEQDQQGEQGPQDGQDQQDGQDGEDPSESNDGTSPDDPRSPETPEPGSNQGGNPDSDRNTEAGDSGEGDDDANAAGGSPESSDRLSRDAAERLLQSVRDKERQRRREKARTDSEPRRTPVEKDW